MSKENIFQHFAINSPKLRSISSSTTYTNDEEHKLVLDVIELISVPGGNDTIGRTMRIDVCTENYYKVDTLKKIVELENSIITTAAVNIRNFDFMGTFDSDLVNSKAIDIMILDGVEEATNAIKYSMEFLFDIFINKNNAIPGSIYISNIEGNNSSVSAPIKITKVINEGFDRKLDIFGKLYSISRETMSLTLNCKCIEYIFHIFHSKAIDDPNPAPVLVIPINISVAMNILKVGGTLTEGDSIVTTDEAFTTSLTNMETSFKSDNILASLTMVTEPTSETITTTKYPIMYKLRANNVRDMFLKKYNIAVNGVITEGTGISVSVNKLDLIGGIKDIDVSVDLTNMTLDTSTSKEITVETIFEADGKDISARSELLVNIPAQEETPVVKDIEKVAVPIDSITKKIK